MIFNPNGPKKRKSDATKKRKLFLNSALRRDSRPISLEGLEALKANGKLSSQAFIDNVGVIFPLILERLSIGDSIPVIERSLGINKGYLSAMVQDHPRLKLACNEARKIKNDRVITDDDIFQ